MHRKGEIRIRFSCEEKSIGASQVRIYSFNRVHTAALFKKKYIRLVISKTFTNKNQRKMFLRVLGDGRDAAQLTAD